MVTMLAVGPFVSAKPMSRDHCLQSQMRRSSRVNGLTEVAQASAQTVSSAHAWQSGVTLAEFKQPNGIYAPGQKRTSSQRILMSAKGHLRRLRPRPAMSALPRNGHQDGVARYRHVRQAISRGGMSLSRPSVAATEERLLLRAHRLGREFDRLGRRCVDLFDQRLDRGAGHRPHVEVGGARLGEKIRILHRGVEG